MGTAAAPSQPQNWVIYTSFLSLQDILSDVLHCSTSRLQPCTFNVPSIDPPIFKFASHFED